jgi:hypothetical protein
MTRESKLKILGLEEKAYEMRKAGETWESVAKIINEQHGKELVKQCGGTLSPMAAKRGILSYERSLIEKSFDEGLDPIKKIDKLFREAVLECNKKNKKLEEKANTILKNALADGTITEQTRALKEARDTITQEVKNLERLQQYGIRQTGHAGDINIKEQKNVIIMVESLTDRLISEYDKLCPECKRKVDFESLLSELH